MLAALPRPDRHCPRPSRRATRRPAGAGRSRRVASSPPDLFSGSVRRGCRSRRAVLSSRLSPGLDLALADPASRVIEAWQPMLGIEALGRAGGRWAKGEDRATLHLSPLHGGPAGLPPSRSSGAATPSSRRNARTGARRANLAGHPIEHVQVPGDIPIHMAATWTPESREAFGRLGAALRADGSLGPRCWPDGPETNQPGRIGGAEPPIPGQRHGRPARRRSAPAP